MDSDLEDYGYSDYYYEEEKAEEEAEEVEEEVEVEVEAEEEVVEEETAEEENYLQSLSVVRKVVCPQNMDGSTVWESMFCPPNWAYQGSFYQAKETASTQNKWLVLNLQSKEEFSSHILNRDTWANDAVVVMFAENFILWQVHDHVDEGRKVRTYYKLNAVPSILLIDPITGAKMWAGTGTVQPQQLLEDLLPFTDKSPKEHLYHNPLKCRCHHCCCLSSSSGRTQMEKDV